MIEVIIISLKVSGIVLGLIGLLYLFYCAAKPIRLVDLFKG